MDINNDLEKLKRDGLFRERRVINSAQGATISIGGKKILVFGNFKLLINKSKKQTQKGI